MKQGAERGFEVSQNVVRIFIPVHTTPQLFRYSVLVREVLGISTDAFQAYSSVIPFVPRPGWCEILLPMGHKSSKGGGILHFGVTALYQAIAPAYRRERTCLPDVIQFMLPPTTQPTSGGTSTH